MKATIRRSLKVLGLLLAMWAVGLACDIVVMQWRVPVNLSGTVEVRDYADGTVTAKGTWTSDQGPLAFPVQTSTIICNRTSMACNEATAEINDDRYLDLSTDNYQVTAWDSTHIVYVDTSPHCVSYVYTIDLVTEAVTGVAARKEDATDPDCSAAPTEMHLTLTGGAEEAKTVNRHAQPWFAAILMLPFKLL